MPGLQLAIIFHLVGIIFWIGGMAARLILLNSARSGAGESVRSQFRQLQQGLHRMMEIPGSVMTLLAGGFLIHAAQVNFHLAWFRAKIALVIGLIVIELLASRQIKTFNVTGRAGQAMGLFAGLVVFTLLILIAVVTKF
ncbi:CopD family protein [Candidatus Methylomirabilis sp.]|uniref:CopD family protein n=1 Tax=Candidatus Methylomirabilis sp. TaxID=2032687 RepID=UPI002A669F3B|nr:CopD family protein [Candidatus Methylomirabilis sp.]